MKARVRPGLDHQPLTTFKVKNYLNYIIGMVLFAAMWLFGGSTELNGHTASLAMAGGIIPMRGKRGSLSGKPASGGLGVMLPESALLKQLQAEYGSKAVISPSYLRQDSEIVSSTAPILWDFKQGVKEVACARPLDDNDLFVATGIGLYLKKTVSLNHSWAQLHTFPNRSVFADVTGFTGAHLEALYHGSLSFSTEGTTYIDALPAAQFRHVPMLPEGTVTAVDASTNFVKSTVAVSPFWDGMSEAGGFGKMTLNGRKRHEFKLSFPFDNTLQIVNQGTAKNWVCLILTGWLVKGVGRATVQ